MADTLELNRDNSSVKSIPEHLSRLHEDSLLSEQEKIKITNGAITREAAVSGAAVLAVSSTGIFAAAAAAKSFKTYDDIEKTIEGKEAETESAAIKRDFGGRLGADRVKAIEAGCQPSSLRTMLTMGANMAEDTAWGFGSGLAFSVGSAGWSIPVFSLAGAGSGTVNGLSRLRYDQRTCEVASFRSELSKGR